MTTGTRSLAAVLCTLTTVLAATLGAAASNSFKVTSTLDGKKVLPHRIHWLGRPTLPQAKIKEVDFLIDGKLAWSEKNPPYSYSDDGGYLVTSGLTPGFHRFTVRAIAKDGGRAVDTISARVPPPPAAPAALAGVWHHTIAATLAPGWPAGTYELVFDQRWVELRHPGQFDPVKSIPTGEGYINYIDWTPGPSSFRVHGPVTLKMQGPNDRVGGWLCEPNGPVASYGWSVSGDTLTLTPAAGKDACAIRGLVWAGQWTKAA